MPFSIVTWNINSVRLRLPIVLKLLNFWKPDVLCLQETKCPDDQFPTAAFRKAGYPNIAMHGQKGYHGVATIARAPFAGDPHKQGFCDKDDTRHVATQHAIEGLADPIVLHNFYVPAGGDEPDVEKNWKFKHKLDFLDEMMDLFTGDWKDHHAVVVGDLNIAPSEHDVWSHKQLLKVVSHTPVEVETLDALRDRPNFTDLVRQHIPEPERLYSWWSYRSRDWAESDRGRRLDHIWGRGPITQKLHQVEILREARGWEKPSDHVPIRAIFS